jgi:hypothetical protein
VGGELVKKRNMRLEFESKSPLEKKKKKKAKKKKDLW